MNVLINLTENDKRLIIAILLIFILLFVIIGFFGILVQKIMKFQGKRGEHLIHDVAYARVCPTEAKLRFYGYRKNIRYFTKTSWIPMLILFIGAATYFICSAAYGHLINLHDFGTAPAGEVVTSGGEGWLNMFFVWDLKHPHHAEFFGMNLISGFDLLSKPHMTTKSIPAYIFFFSMVIGGVWWFICVQAYIARAFYIYKASRKAFLKNMDDIDGNTPAPFVPKQEEKQSQVEQTTQPISNQQPQDNTSLEKPKWVE